jgi:cell division septum initiation protein DivIVA
VMDAPDPAATTTEFGGELPQFANVMRGYDRGQVDDYVSRLNDFVEDAERRAERAERALAEANRRSERLADELRQALDRSSGPPQPHDGLGERLESILRLATEEAEAIQQRARAEAEELTDTARRMADQEIENAERELSRISERRDGVVGELRRVQDVLATLGLRPPVGDAEADAGDLDRTVVNLRQVDASTG